MQLHLLRSKVKEVLKKEGDVLFAYLFGSQATGLTYYESDIDLAVYLRPGEMKYYLKRDEELLSKLISSLETDQVDLKILNVSPLLLQFRIVSDGESTFVRDQQAKVDFETSVLYRYFEIKPFFDEYNRLIKEMIKRGG